MNMPLSLEQSIRIDCDDGAVIIKDNKVFEYQVFDTKHKFNLTYNISDAKISIVFTILFSVIWYILYDIKNQVCILVSDSLDKIKDISKNNSLKLINYFNTKIDAPDTLETFPMLKDKSYYFSLSTMAKNKNLMSENLKEEILCGKFLFRTGNGIFNHRGYRFCLVVETLSLVE